MQIVTTKATAKVAAVATTLAMASSVLSFAPFVHAQTATSTACTITTDLTIGSTGAQVECLQKALVAAGHLTMPMGVAYGYFGTLTQSAVAKWQAANGITPAAGYFGPISRGKFVPAAAGATCTTKFDPNTGLPCTSTGGGNTSGGPLSGGAGSISEADYISSLNNEEVGEDEEDAEVAGLEIEADEGSDIELTAVTLDFDYADTGGDDDLDEYAAEVSVWFNGEEVARVDAEDFNDDNNYKRTVSLDSGAVIEAGETGDLVVAVSGLSNLDSDNTGENWNVQFEAVRFRDADGASITENNVGDINDSNDDTTTDSDERQFSFESFATAADVELHITAGDDEINDARSLEVDDSDETNDVEILAFNAEVEGESDLVVDDIVVEFVVTGASNLDDMVTEITLLMDGEEVGSENVPTNDETVTFDDLDLELTAGDEYEFTVEVDLLGTNGNLDAGDTILAKVTSTELNAWNVEDETGEDLADGTEKTGSATSEAHTVFENGISVNAISTSREVNEAEDTGTFTIVVDVTAFGEDQYIHKLATTAASSTDAGFYLDVFKGGVATSTNISTSTAVTSNADEDGEYFKIDEGTTERFTITVTVNPDAAGLYSVALDDLRFDPNNAADSESTDDTYYSVPSSEDTETQPIQVDQS